MTLVCGKELRELLEKSGMENEMGKSTGKYQDCAREIILVRNEFDSFIYNGDWKLVDEIMKILEKNFGPSNEKHPEFNTDRLCKHKWEPYPGKPSGRRCLNGCGGVTAVPGKEEDFQEEFKDFD